MEDRAVSRKNKRDALTPSLCEIPGCDWTYNFQRHRIVPGRDGGKYKLGNVIALCPNHHSLADDGVVPAEYLLEIVIKRIEHGQATTESEQRPSSTEVGGGSPPEEPGSGNGECSSDAADGLEDGFSS